jgi:ABC-type uncharacterized transport system substrate-binding protein
MSLASLFKMNHCRAVGRGIALLMCMLLSGASLAHPHSWVDITTEIQGDANQITGFKMRWTFDAMTSAYMLDGEDLSADNKENTLQQLADSIMHNMMAGHYLTYFYEGDNPIKYAMAQNASLTQQAIKATLTFDLPLAKPKILSDKPLKLLIYDPSYYVDMSWLSKSDIQLSPELAKRCALTLVSATPSSEQIAYVMALPVDASRDNALGELFTQAVTISCNAEQG